MLCLAHHGVHCLHTASARRGCVCRLCQARQARVHLRLTCARGQPGHFAGNLFPVPARFVTPDASRPQPQQLRGASPAVERSAGPAPFGRDAGDALPGMYLQPVFRASPYRAEAARQRAGSTTARLLFVDEGNHCRCAPFFRTEQYLWCLVLFTCA